MNSLYFSIYSWTAKFKHVVGIVHTNYFVYAQEQPAAYLRVGHSIISLDAPLYATLY